jgi:DnaJ-class molecular chaperone
MKAYPDCNGDRVKTCPDCNGDGVVDKETDDEHQCPICGGLGFVADDDDDHEEVIKTSRIALSVTNVGGKP